MIEYNYGDIGPAVLMKAKEGNLTISSVSTPQGKLEGAVFAAPISKGDIVVLKGDMAVGRRLKNSSEKVIGVAVSEPEFVGKEPTSPANEGAYEPRRVSVQLYGKAVRMVKLPSNNAAVTAGDYLALDSNNDQMFVKSTDPTKIIALEGASQNSGAEIAALVGYYL